MFRTWIWMLTNSRALAPWRRNHQRLLDERWYHWRYHYLEAKRLELAAREGGADGTA